MAGSSAADPRSRIFAIHVLTVREEDIVRFIDFGFVLNIDDVTIVRNMKRQRPVTMFEESAPERRLAAPVAPQEIRFDPFQ